MNNPKKILVSILVLSIILSLSLFISAAEEGVVAFLAVDFTKQDGGDVQFPADRGYPCVSHWDYTGHWLEWEVEIPSEGIYIPIFRYSTGNEVAERKLSVNGEYKLDILFFSTGGFGRQASEWGFAMAEPLNLTAGKTRITIENSTAIGNKAGLNLAWTALIPLELLMLDDSELIELVDNLLDL